MGSPRDERDAGPPKLDYAGPRESPPEPGGCLGFALAFVMICLLLGGGAVTAGGLSLLGMALVHRSPEGVLAGAVFTAFGGGGLFLGWLIHWLAFRRPPAT